MQPPLFGGGRLGDHRRDGVRTQLRRREILMSMRERIGTTRRMVDLYARCRASFHYIAEWCQHFGHGCTLSESLPNYIRTIGRGSSEKLGF